MAAPARKTGSDLRLREVDELFDVEVPAAVVCAQCGDADCPGCQSELSRSGVVTIVAWERPGGRTLGKMWETAHAATRDAEAFFELLPDGPIAPALRVALDPGARELALRIFATGVPGLALLLVLAHAAHGLSLDLGAKKSGARPAASRALRFGLYATGWDLVQSPIGAVVIGIKRGLGAWVSMHLSGVPTRSSRAFLRGCYRLGGKAADRAL